MFDTPFATPRPLGQLRIWGNYAKEQPSDCFYSVQHQTISAVQSTLEGSMPFRTPSLAQRSHRLLCLSSI